jgi:hypothetical protein
VLANFASPLTANALTTDELSPSAQNVLRRWVLSERYDSDPAGAIAVLHGIVTNGRGDEDEVITLAEMAYQYGEKTHQRPYYLAAAIYSYAFLFPEKGFEPPSPYDPRLRLVRLCAMPCASSTRPERTLALSEMVVIGHSQGGLLAKTLVVDTGDRVWNAIAYKPIDQVDLSPEGRDLLGRAVFIEPLPNVRRVVFIATPHSGSYLTEYPVAELVGRFITLPVRVLRTAADLARVGGDFKIDPNSLGSGSLFGMTPNNPVVETMADTPIAPGVHANSIIAVAGNGPVEGSDDGVVKYSSSHLEGVDSEYIVRSGHSVQSNPYAIEEVRRILLLHAAEACARIACGSPPP